MSYSALSLDHFASGGGTTVVFRAGLTAQSHRWDIKARSGSLLARASGPNAVALAVLPLLCGLTY